MVACTQKNFLIHLSDYSHLYKEKARHDRVDAIKTFLPKVSPLDLCFVFAPGQAFQYLLAEK